MEGGFSIKFKVYFFNIQKIKINLNVPSHEPCNHSGF